MYSLREFMAKDSRANIVAQLLTTTTLGLVLPNIKEDFGDGKKVDVVGTLSSSYIEAKIPDTKPTGIRISEDGDIGIVINAAF